MLSSALAFLPWRRQPIDHHRPLIFDHHYVRLARSDDTLPYPASSTQLQPPSVSEMPYATPTAVLAPPQPTPIYFPSPSSYSLESNTSLDGLHGVPRSKSSARPRLGAPSPSRDNFAFHSTSSASDLAPGLRLTTLVVHPPTPDSPPKAKRVRGQRTPTFTTAVASSSESQSDSDVEPEPAQLEQPDMTTIGRKRGGEMMRHAATVDVPQPPPVQSAALSPSPSEAAPVLTAKRFHQAVMAGQGGILRLNMDAIKRARSASPSTAAAVTISSATAASYLNSNDGKAKFNTVGPQFVRKKSGELVKPALRTSRTYSNAGDDDDLTPVFLPTPTPVAMTPSSSASSAFMFRRNSAPSTPTPKNVHFDAKLEHVKLFLAEQKPAAVSRDGSPTAYGSTTEEEGYPWHALPRRGSAADDEEKARGKLTIKVVDADASECDATDEAKGPYAKVLEKNPDVGVKLESLVLVEDGNALKGSIAVKNIAFDKRVAARFTLDWWQTTSEVVGKYEESVSAPPPARSAPMSMGYLFEPPSSEPTATHDRFTFVIRLGDMLPKIAEKTLFVAIRYNVAGMEMWDNNHGKNYQVSFERAKPTNTGRGRLAPPVAAANDASPSPAKRKDGSPTKGGSPTKEWSPVKDQMSDLRKELERVVLEDDDEDDARLLRRPVFRKDSAGAKKPKSISLPPASVSNQSSPSMSPHLPLEPIVAPPKLTAQLSSRYDLTASLTSRTNSWNPDTVSTSSPISWNPPALPSSPRLPWKPTAAPISAAASRVPFPRAGSESPPKRTVAAAGIVPPRMASTSLESPRDHSHFDAVDDGSMGSSRGRNHHRAPSYFDGWMEAVRASPKQDDVLQDEQDVEDAVAVVSDDDETEKEQEREVLNLLGLRRNNTNLTAAAPTAANMTRFNSFPQTTLTARQQQHHHQLLSPMMAESIASTPSATSASSPSQSPSTPPHSLPDSPSNDLEAAALLNLHHDEGVANAPSTGRVVDSQDYNFFLNRFCFYTGGDDASGDSTFPAARRIHSESEVGNYFATNNGPMMYDYAHPQWSGTSTPTSITSPSDGKGGITTPRPGTPSDMMTPVRR